MKWNNLWNPPTVQRASTKPKRRRKRVFERKSKSRNIPEFFHSKEWAEVRYKVLKRDNATCLACGRSARHGVIMNVDHIKSRRRHPELALDMNNLQTLCSRCNRGKGWKDDTDWRSEEKHPLDLEYEAIMRDQEDSP